MGEIAMVHADKKSVDVSRAASAEGLKEDLYQEAANRGMTLSALVTSIYLYAVQNQNKFSSALKNARTKPGEPICVKVNSSLADRLKSWANSKNTKRTLHCCYILEKVLESKLLEEIIPEEIYQ